MPRAAFSITQAPAVDPRGATGVDTGLLLLRVAAFGMLTIRGAQKLFGVFGGKGLEETAAGFGRLGYEPALFFAVLGGGSEFVGGLLLTLGLFTPLAAAMALGVMVNAVAVAAGKGLDHAGYPILLAVLAASLAITGPGRYALDQGRRWNRTGYAIASASIGIGLLTAIAVLLARS
jgi:putative oxidoreductase